MTMRVLPIYKIDSQLCAAADRIISCKIAAELFHGV